MTKFSRLLYIRFVTNFYFDLNVQREIGVGPNLYEDANARARTKSDAFQVQDQYEKTLEESEKLLLERSATEQLAKQLSRGLRIRRSAEQRVIRSPSARKIGAIRRRSRESPIANLTNSVNKFDTV